MRDELLDGEVFHPLRKARIPIEQWRRHDNTVCPDSAPGAARRRQEAST